MEIVVAPPHPRLASLVRGYAERSAVLVAETVLAPPARPDQFLEFYLAEPYRVSADGEAPGAAPVAVLVGPQSRAGLTLHLAGTLRVFTIHFRPTGLHRLTGMPMERLADRGVAAGDVFGARCAGLDAAVRRAPDFAQRVAAAERWLGGALDAAAPRTTLDAAVDMLADRRGAVRIERLVAASELSARQFQRRFTEAVGVPAKLYARTLRLEHALGARLADPARSWADIALEAGYGDQSHMIRDFRALGGRAPNRLVAETSNLPRAMLG